MNLLSHVYILPYRHPTMAAKAFSTLDHLSGGRAICGVGAGHIAKEFELLGADYEHRGAELAARVPQLITALEQEAVADGFGARPRPAQSPRPPVWMAGSTPAAIKRAARLADGWLPQGPSDDAMVDLLDATREQAGRADLPMAIGHITPFLHVGTPALGRRRRHHHRLTGTVADRILAGAPARANQIQVRFKSRTLEEHCDQMAAFGAEVAPLIAEALTTPQERAPTPAAPERSEGARRERKLRCRTGPDSARVTPRSLSEQSSCAGGPRIRVMVSVWLLPELSVHVIFTLSPG